jgi:hypothetical protein
LDLGARNAHLGSGGRNARDALARTELALAAVFASTVVSAMERVGVSTPSHPRIAALLAKLALVLELTVFVVLDPI